MSFLLHILGSLVSTAQAVTIERVGSDGEGISAMWSQIMDIFPHTDAGTEGPIILLMKVVAFVLTFIGGAAVAVIAYGGIRLIMSQGENTDEIKQMILYAVVGVILAITADAIIFFAVQLINAAAGG